MKKLLISTIVVSMIPLSGCQSSQSTTSNLNSTKDSSISHSDESSSERSDSSKIQSTISQLSSKLVELTHVDEGYAEVTESHREGITYINIVVNDAKGFYNLFGGTKEIDDQIGSLAREYSTPISVFVGDTAIMSYSPDDDPSIYPEEYSHPYATYLHGLELESNKEIYENNRTSNIDVDKVIESGNALITIYEYYGLNTVSYISYDERGIKINAASVYIAAAVITGIMSNYTVTSDSVMYATEDDLLRLVNISATEFSFLDVPILLSGFSDVDLIIHNGVVTYDPRGYLSDPMY